MCERVNRKSTEYLPNTIQGKAGRLVLVNVNQKQKAFVQVFVKYRTLKIKFKRYDNFVPGLFPADLRIQLGEAPARKKYGLGEFA